MIRRGLLAGHGVPTPAVDAADFNGSSQRLTRAGILTGLVDGKVGTLSAWVRLDADPTGSGCILACGISASTRFSVSYIPASDLFQIIGSNSAGTTIFNVSSASTFAVGANWIHILASWDLATAGTMRQYINDASDLTETTYTNDTIDYAGDNVMVGANISINAFFNGAIAELWFDPTSYMDFSVVANRRKFRSAGGKPVYLGSDGSLPTGTAPLLYLHLDDGESSTNFASNKGTGGSFTNSSSPSGASSSPSD